MIFAGPVQLQGYLAIWEFHATTRLAGEERAGRRPRDQGHILMPSWEAAYPQAQGQNPPSRRGLSKFMREQSLGWFSCSVELSKWLSKMWRSKVHTMTFLVPPGPASKIINFRLATIKCILDSERSNGTFYCSFGMTI